RRRQFARACGLPGPDVIDGLVRRPVRDVGGHCDEVFHGRLLLVRGSGTTTVRRKRISIFPNGPCYYVLPVACLRGRPGTNPGRIAFTVAFGPSGRTREPPGRLPWSRPAY